MAAVKCRECSCEVVGGRGVRWTGHATGCRLYGTGKNGAKPEPRAKPVKRWTVYQAPNGHLWLQFDGYDVDEREVAKLLNRAGVVLPKARRR